MNRPRIGLALGSGSARGWSHIGVIEALREAGIEPDIVCGTSMGALVGAAYVADRLDALKEWAEAATWREIGALLDLRFSGGGLIDGTRIRGLLVELGISRPIESYGRAFAAVATDFQTGREIWLREGEIDRAVRASIALPGIFSPVEMDGKWLMDGGLVNPVPVSTCRALGADFTIAVNLNGDLVGRRVVAVAPPNNGEGEASLPANGGLAAFLERLPEAIRTQAAQIAPTLVLGGPRSPSYFEVLANSINIMQDQITRTRLAGEPPHILLLPRLRDMRLMDFHRAGEAIAEGRAATEMALPGIRRQLGLDADGSSGNGDRI